jgi:hypothetical protein
MITVVSKDSQRLWKAQFGDKNAGAIRYFPHLAAAVILAPTAWHAERSGEEQRDSPWSLP